MKVVSFFKFNLFAQLLIASLASAHPASSNYISQMGQGTELHVLREINIPSMVQTVYFIDGQSGSGTFVPSGYSEVGYSYCSLTLKKPEAKDRVIKVGRVMRLQSNPQPYDGYIFIEYPASVDYIRCFGRTTGGMIDKSAQTIGAFERHTNGYFNIVYPEPEEIK